MYILVCTDYVTKWVKAKSFSNAIEDDVVSILSKDLFTHFGVTREIVLDQGYQFKSKMVQKIVDEYKVKHRKYTPYHPQ